MRTTRKALNPLRPDHRFRSVFSAIALFSVAGFFFSSTAPARADGPDIVLLGGPDIIRVEEDWELAIATPEPEANAPQVVCVFGPEDPEHNTHAVFELNHGTFPDFSAGGMQIQCWWQNYLLSYRNHPNNAQFDAAIDTVTFTTVTEVSGGKLNLEITNGNSLTWGSFGGEGYLKISLNTWRRNLNQYNADHSVKHTRVSFGANRVNRLVRREVRYYSTTGLESTDTEDKYVHQLVIDQPQN